MIDHVIAGNRGMTARCQRKMLVKNGCGAAHHFCPALRIISDASCQFAVLADHVRAVKRVIETTPAGIGSIQGIARIADRNHQLWSAQACHFWIKSCRLNAKIRRLRHKIADVFEKELVALGIVRHRAVTVMPVIDLRLQFVALLQQATVDWCVRGDKPSKPGPELVCGQRQAGERFLFNEISKQWVN